MSKSFNSSPCTSEIIGVPKFPPAPIKSTNIWFLDQGNATINANILWKIQNFEKKVG